MEPRISVSPASPLILTLQLLCPNTGESLIIHACTDLGLLVELDDLTRQDVADPGVEPDQIPALEVRVHSASLSVSLELKVNLNV